MAEDGAGLGMTEPLVSPAIAANPWYADWQHHSHAAAFDTRTRLGDADLVRYYETFNDIQLLNERLSGSPGGTLVEVGCATGELYRYLRRRHPGLRYYGLDVSRAAIDRAKAKYPQAQFFVTNPSTEVAEAMQAVGLATPPRALFAKDVLHHQVDPFGFLSQLLRAGGEHLVFRTRTRDLGPTVLDPEQSCQYHYAGWMPYIVLNLEELIAYVQREAPEGEIVVYRNHMMLGGRENRFLPKACYLPQTGTAETAVGVFRRTTSPGRVTVLDRREPRPRFTFGHRLQMVRAWLSRGRGEGTPR